MQRCFDPGRKTDVKRVNARSYAPRCLFERKAHAPSGMSKSLLAPHEGGEASIQRQCQPVLIR